jgi:hypothetical protein
MTDTEMHLTLTRYGLDRRYHERVLKKFEQGGYYPNSMKIETCFGNRSRTIEFVFTEDLLRKRKIPKPSNLIACLENLPFREINVSYREVCRI